MRNAVGLAFVMLALQAGLVAQELPILRLRVSVPDATRVLRPAARHTLLISEVPISASPRAVTTSPDGTAQIRLRPGTYIVESERPLIFDGRAYEWNQSITIAAGRDATLELTHENATISTATAESDDGAAGADASADSTPPSLLTTWQPSVFGLWTPLTHASGFLVDTRGLVATSAAAIGQVSSVDVQVSATTKVAGTVVSAPAPQGVAIVRVHPDAVTGLAAFAVPCEETVAPASTAGATDAREADPSELAALFAPYFGPADATAVPFVTTDAAGGPAFDAHGRVAGLVTPPVMSDERRARASVARVAEICAAIAQARATLATEPPDRTRLPVEPGRLAPSGRTTTPAAGLSFNLSSYQVSSSDFDITLLTPPLMAWALERRGWTGGRTDTLAGTRVATDFEQWHEYVSAAPPMLYVRVTPRLVEGFWMKVARGAAATQGAQLPPIKRLRPGFSQLRLMCGGVEVRPIQPFRLQARITETEAIEEGLYAFDPVVVGPHCGTVTIEVSSVKEPDRVETRSLDPAIVRRVWEDLALARASTTTSRARDQGSQPERP